jgi:hypothetical protein
MHHAARGRSMRTTQLVWSTCPVQCRRSVGAENGPQPHQPLAQRFSNSQSVREQSATHLSRQRHDHPTSDSRDGCNSELHDNTNPGATVHTLARRAFERCEDARPRGRCSPASIHALSLAAAREMTQQRVESQGEALPQFPTRSILAARLDTAFGFKCAVVG